MQKILPSPPFNPLHQGDEAVQNSDYFTAFKDKFRNMIGTDDIIRQIISIIEKNHWDFYVFIDGLDHIINPNNAISNEDLKLDEQSIKFGNYFYKTSTCKDYKAKEGFYEKRNIFSKSNCIFGKKIFNDGKIEIGEFQFIPELKAMGLVDGKITWPTGSSHKGKFQFISNLNEMRLVEGEKKSKGGSIQTGKFQFISNLNEMSLVEGEIIFENGVIQNGKWDYIPEIEYMMVVEGTISKKGFIENGKWDYISEIKIMHLVEGEVTRPDGTMKQGTWTYNESKNDMVFSPK